MAFKWRIVCCVLCELLKKIELKWFLVFCDKIDIDSALYSAIQQGRLVVQVQLMK